ncbi:DUF3927 family protein [Escherichia coli]|uniref:DUF3927 domain-containing protein n=2 Tax=Escherichia coli TaxID=562 RepID=A0A3T9KVY7_ECOLX|nr:DUF3927 family protein [Escherichia coli]EFP6927040.1 DUF3927 domain-containing protein [Shigella dysenteriae]EFY6116889.1 DUF3927 domain-containing protein [Shigella sonnei]HDL6818813.1 DUF3927 family protein [Escherichia coli 290_10]EEC7454296.1 DUF3927 domain-containing protein [Escherichia coli]EEC7950227.1 DUF3927 domain-containing protein [Escherichia coli]
MTVKMRLAVVALLLFLVVMVVMVDFSSRIMSVLADGVLVAGVVVVAFPLLKKKASGD